MRKVKINPAHPGKVLKEEFMEPLGVSNYKLAKASGISQAYIGRIVKGKANLTAEIALRLEAVFGMDAQTWLNMQNTYDLLMVQHSSGKKIAKQSTRLYEEVSARA